MHKFMKLLSKIKIALVVFMGAMTVMIAYPNSPLALAVDPTTEVCSGVEAVSGQDCDTANGSAELSGVVEAVIRILQVFAGLLSVFYLIYAGIKFITSSGGSDGVKTAKNTILYVAVGLIVVLIAEGIIRFVLVRFA